MRQLHPVSGHLDVGVGLFLDDLLVRLEQLRLRLFEGELLIGRVELDDDVAGLDLGAGVEKGQEAQRTADGRRHDGLLARGAEVAVHVDSQLQRSALDAGGRHRRLVGVGREPGHRRSCDHDGCDGQGRHDDDGRDDEEATFLHSSRPPKGGRYD